MKTENIHTASQAPMRRVLSMTKHTHWFALAFLAVLGGVPAVLAATDTWNGASSASAFWNDGANWVAATAPNTNDALIFDGTFQLNNTNNLTANAPFGGLTFAATAGAFVLNGNAIAPSNSPAVTIADNATVPEAINLNIAPPTNIIFSIASGASLTNNGVLSGSGIVSQTGSGILTLTATNTFSGPIGGIAGTLAIGGAGLLSGGFYTNSSARITNNGTFSYNSSASQTIGATINSTINGVMSGTGQLVVNGPGTLTLSASNNYTGGTVVNGGVLALNFNGPTNNDGGLPTIVGTLTINPGGRVNTLIVDALGYVASPSAINIIGGTFNNNVSGNEGYATTFNLTGATISSTGGGGINMTTNFNFNSFATNIVSTISAPVVSRGLNLTYTVAAGTVPNGIDLLASGVQSANGGNGVLVKAGAGILAMTATNTFNGGLVVSNGTFDLNGGGRLNSGNFGGFITNLAIINFNTTNSQTISGSIAGSGVLNQNAGSLSLSGINTYSGATTVNAGELIGVTGGSLSNSAVTIATGATNGVQVAIAGGQFTTANLTFNSGITYLDFNFANNAVSSSSAPLNVNGNLTLGGTLNIIIRNTFGIPAGDFPLIKYSGTLSGAPPATVFVLPTGVTATIFNNTANQSIDLNITTGNQITWAAGSGNWDFSTPNWKSGANPVSYADGNFVVFEDTQSGGGPIKVTLNTTVNPANALFNNSLKSYSIVGSGTIAGAASLIKQGANSLTLTNNETYTNSTTLDDGTTVLDYTEGAANNIISANSPLIFGGGTLNIIGNASLASSQTFTNTTFSGGNSVINVSGSTAPNVALGVMSEAIGATVVLNGPATDTGATGSSSPVAATGTITTTTAGTGFTGGLIASVTGAATQSGYVTVGLYDWAATTGTTPFTIVGGSQVGGFYTVLSATGNQTITGNADITATTLGSHNTDSGVTLRFNTPTATTFSLTGIVDGPGILVTPNVGPNNVTIAGTPNYSAQRSGANRATVFWQNNINGFLVFNQIVADTTAPNQFIQSGIGTVDYLLNNTYTGQTYLNGGVSLFNNTSTFGPAASAQTINLNGGDLLASVSVTLDNGGGANKRPLSIGFNGGGLGAISGKTLVVDGVISGAAGTGPLWIGIPASSANGNVLGLLPGTGNGTANTTATNATGTVNLTGANTYAGGTLLYSGILNFIPGSLGSGGVTFAGGTLQWSVGNTTDISANTVGIQSAGGILDVNGNTITLANPIGAGGNGGLTLISSSPNGVLNLNGANTYTGNTTISAGTTLSLNNSIGSATGSGNLTVQNGGVLSGGGAIAGNLVVNSGGIVAPGNGVGALRAGSLTINSGSVYNFEFNSTPANDLIVSGALTINDPSDSAAFNLYQVGTTLPLGVSGTYRLIQYSGSIGGTGLDSSWTTPGGFNPHVANPQVGSIYSFGASGGYLTVTISVDPTVTIGTWSIDANGNWSDNSKWSSNPNVPGSPGPGDSATFGVGSAFRTVTLNANESVGGIRFTNNNSFLIADAGQTLFLNNKGGLAPIYVSAGTSNTIQTAVALTDSGLINVGSGKSLAFSGIISNTTVAKILTLNGAGIVSFLGNNTYGPAAGSFGTTLANGTLLIGNNNSLGAGDVAITGSSTIAAVATVTVANNVDIASGINATVTNATANSLTLNGVISDSGTLVKTGSGIVTLNGANTYTGGTTVNSGTISISQDANLGTVAPIVLNGGGLLANATTSLDPNRNINLGLASGTATATGLLDAANSQSLTVPGTINSAGNTGINNLAVNSLPSSTGTVLLSGANTFGGTTVIGNGTLQLVSSNALQNSTLNYNGSGSLAIDSSITTTVLGALNGSNNISLLNLSSTPVGLTVGGNNASTTYYGNLSDGGLGASLTKNGSGTFTLKGTNIITGNATGNNGTLEITNAGVLNVGAIGGQGFTVDGGTLIAPNTSSFNTVGNAFLESSGTVIAGTFQSSQNDGTLISITGGSFSANNVILRRTGNNALPTATAPVAAPTGNGFFINGNTAVVNLGGLTIGNNNSSCAVLLNAGYVAVTNEILLGDQSATAGRCNILQVNGGLLNSMDTVNGLVIAQNNAGNANDGELYLSGGTTLAQLIAFGNVNDGTGGGGWLFMTSTNASLYVGAGGITQPNTAGYVSTVVLTSGLLGALTNWESPLPMQLNGTSFTFQAAYTNGVGTSLSNNIELDGVLSGASTLIKTGGGILTLTGANTLTGNIFVKQGTLAVSNSIGTIPNIFVTNGAVLDVSAAPFTLGASQTLQSSGTNNGSVSTTSGSKIYAGTDGTYGTNTFNNNLALVVGATVNLDVGTNFNGTNDLINVGGNLTLNGNGLHLKAPSNSVNLYTNNDYVLLNVAGTISGSFASAPVWDIPPVNASRFAIVTDSIHKQVRLHAFGAGVIAPTAIGSANPSTVYALQTSLITVTVTPGSSSINSVVLDASLYGGPSSVSLVQIGATSVYTNTITFSSNPTIGSFLLPATVTDAAGSTAVATIALNVQPGLYWSGGAGDNNWGSGANWLGGTAPATSGSILTFAGATRTTPNMETAYSIAGLTFDPTASSFILGSASSSTLTLAGSVTNNSPNAQTFNLTVDMTGVPTINTASNNITMNGPVVDGGFIKAGTNTLILTNNNNGFNGVTLNGSSGTLALLGDYSGGVGQISVASSSAVLLGSANAAANSTLNMRGGSTLQLRANSNTTFAVVSPITAPSSSGALNFDVNDLTSGFTGNALALNATLAFSSSSDQTINVTGNSTYTLGLGAITLTSSSHNPFFNLYVNTLPTGPSVTIASVTFGNWGSDLDLNGGGNVTVSGPLTPTSNGEIILFINNGTTVTLQGQSTVVSSTPDGNKYDVMNGTLVLDNSAALFNNTIGTGLDQALFILGAATNILSGAAYTYAAGVLTATNNNFNAAVYLGDTNNNTGGLYVDQSVTNFVSDGDVGFTNSGTFIIGGQNTSGINSYNNPIFLGWTANRGKSVTLVAATGGEVDFDGGIFKNGTDTNAGVTIGNGPNFAGIVGFQNANTYAGNTTISNGTLALNGAGSVASSSSINIGAGATFDSSALGGFTLGTVKPQTMKGNGTVNGNLTTLAGSTLTPGNLVGVLTVNGNTTLGGLVAMNLNRTNTPINSSRLVVTGTLTGGGTLTVTNMGPALQVNDTFQLFSTGVSGFAAVNIATNDANKVVYTWENDLATLGSIKVTGATPLINTNAATANFKATTVGGSLQFSWAPDHLGWQLYTNAVGLTASSSWFPISGSATVTNETITINPAKPNVFFQLRYP